MGKRRDYTNFESRLGKRTGCGRGKHMGGLSRSIQRKGACAM